MIPASTHQCIAAPLPVIIWVKSGHAHVSVNGDEEELGRNVGIWLPGGSAYSVQTEVGSVVFLLQIPDEGKGPRFARRFRTDSRSSAAIVHLLSHQLAYLQPNDDAFRLLTQAIVEGARPLRVLPPGLLPPPNPHSLRLQRLAAEADDSPRPHVADLADEAMLSLRGLQRRWEAETGMSVGRWFRQRSLHRAAQLLLDGYRTDWASDVAGFSSTSGFIRAFTRVSGMTPGRFLQDRQGFGPASGEGLRPLRLPEQWSIPPQSTWPRVNLADVAIWVYWGSCSVTLGKETLTLSQGDGIVLPRGIPNALTTSPGGIVVPVGYSALDAPPPRISPVPNNLSEQEDLMLHCLAATYTPLRPPGHQALRGLNVVAGTALVEQRNAGEAPSTDCGRDWAVVRRQRRLNHARELLAAGGAPSEASREIGYAHPSAFTRAFRREYGITPRQYANSLGSQADWRRHWPPASGHQGSPDLRGRFSRL